MLAMQIEADKEEIHTLAQTPTKISQNWKLLP
jgi:hypothetical protein